MAEFLSFSVWAESGKGLLARPMLPNEVIALQSHISNIDYEVWDNTTPPSVKVAEGVLAPADVMLTAPAKWRYDKVGYTFSWPADGDLWPDPDKSYRVIVIFTISNAFGPSMLGKKFLLVWEARTKNPPGEL